MKSIEIIVPRKLIDEFYPHPELYGDFIVELQNGMITDVYYNEERDFITITSEEDLIDYLNSQDTSPTEFYFRNGVFALRLKNVSDKQRLDNWNIVDGLEVTDFMYLTRDQLNESLSIPKFMITTFYWIEVGITKITQAKNGIKISLEIYDKKYLDESIQKGLLTQFDIDTCFHIIKEYLTSKLLN